MNFDEYNKLITDIHNQLQTIADNTFNQAMAGCADSDNSAFVALMNRHNKLTKLSAELTERMLQQMSNKK